MPENMQDDVPESINSLGNQHLKLKLDIEEEKLHYKIKRRPLAWFFALLSIDSIIVILSSLAIYLFGSGSFVGRWSIFTVIVSTIIFISLAVYFLLDYTDKYTKEEWGFKGVERIKDLISLKEGIEMLQIQLRLIEEIQAARRPRKDKFADDISQKVQQYTRGANYNRRFYYILQIIIIFCSLLVTGLTSGLTGLISILGKPWLTPAISFAVSFLTAMVTLFRFRERGHNLQLTADAIQYEISCATKGIYGYKSLPEEDAYIKLAEEVERLINEQRKRQQQLEQASDTKQTSE